MCVYILSGLYAIFINKFVMDIKSAVTFYKIISGNFITGFARHNIYINYNIFKYEYIGYNEFKLKY